MTDPPPADRAGTTRRRFVLHGLGGLGTLASAPLLLAACGDDDTPSPRANAGSSADGPWSFTDDRGTRISLDARPQRIIAYDTAASALWYQGIVPTAIFGAAPLKDNTSLAGLDVNETQSVGDVYGEVNLEKLAALKPDLIVTAYDPEQTVLFGFKDDKQQKKVQSFAPIAAIDAIPLPTKVIERFAALAALLGADPKAAGREAQRQRFDDAVAKLRTTAAGKKDVAVVAVAGFEDGLYFGRPARFPALKEYQGWGVNFVDTGVKPRNGAKKFDPSDFWTVVSYERADAFPADLIMHDVQAGSLTLAGLAKKPTWRSLPAVKAGQLVEWQKVQAWNYPLYTKEIELLTAGLQRADPRLAS
jgi:iron-desferrioxamine transport system substrate-binding protein